MRKLTKGPKPRILAQNEDMWTTEYVEATKTNTQDRHEHWRHAEIKAGVRDETSGRCAYCEIDVSAGAYLHVEHIVPKKHHPELAHRWPNLTLACPRCNTEKRDYYHPDFAILSPYEDEVGEHIDFLGDFVSPVLGSQRGDITVRKLKLNRPDLVYARVDRLAKVRDLVERWHVALDPHRGVLAEAIRLDAEEGEFSASVRRYLRHLEFPLEIAE